MAYIYNSDAVVIGSLTLSPNNATGNFLTIDGTGVVRFRTPAEVLSDIGVSSPLTTKGDIYTYDTDESRLAVGNNYQILTADSTEPSGLKWQDPEWLGEAPNDGQEWVRKNEGWVLNSGGSSVGESNTASSAGTGVSLFKQKIGSDLQFNAIKSENSILTVSLDAATSDIELTVDQTAITITESQISDLTHTTNTDTQLTNEQVQDIMGASWVSGTNTTFTYDDVLNTLKIDSIDTNTTYSNLSEFTNDVGFITGYTETDPIFVASDAFSTTNANGINTGDNAVNSLYSGLVSFPGFTSLSADYGFTDNSANWNTAFSWGDHSGTYVGLLGNETVAGIKTFSSFSVTPSSAPTSDYNVANKKYVDDAIVAAGGYTNEQAQDAVGGIMSGSGATSVVYDDVANTIVISSTNTTYTNVSEFTNDLGYITGYTETDPVFTASPSAGITSTNITNWNTAFGWGDHSTEGYLTSFDITTQTDPKYVKVIGDIMTGTLLIRPTATTDASLKIQTSTSAALRAFDFITEANSDQSIRIRHEVIDGNLLESGYAIIIESQHATPNDDAHLEVEGNIYSKGLKVLTSFTETDPIFQAHVSSGIVSQDIVNWNTAFGWGDHSTQGYLTSETDSQTLSFGLSTGELTISNGNTVDLDGRYLQSFNITTQTDPKYLRSDADDIAGGQITFDNHTVHLEDLHLNEGVGIVFDIDSDVFNSIRYDANFSVLTYYSSGSHVFKNGEDDGYELLVAYGYSTNGGTSSQFLKADGTLDSSTYLTDSSGLVPYTGATGSVDLGVYTLTSSVQYSKGVVVNESSGTANAVNIQTSSGGSSLSVAGTGYISLFSNTADYFSMLFGTASKWADFDGSNLTGRRTLALPDNSGTIPLSVNGEVAGTDGNIVLDPRPYKVYTALLSQSGTNAPNEDHLLENTLGTITFQYISDGNYRINSTALFDSDKTTVVCGNLGLYHTGSIWSNSSRINLSTSVNGVYTNGGLIRNMIEIRVYY